jgi:carbon monoxide dehydrogenase subunit G
MGCGGASFGVRRASAADRGIVVRAAGWYSSGQMKIQGTHHLAAPPQRVFDQLVDPALLQSIIPGCETMERTGADQYRATLKLGLAGIKGQYTGTVRLRDQQPPHKFTLDLEGTGKPGFVKGTTQVELAPEGSGTRLQFSADVQVGGLIAAVGSRVTEAAARKLIAEFFERFAQRIAPQA